LVERKRVMVRLLRNAIICFIFYYAGAAYGEVVERCMLMGTVATLHEEGVMINFHGIAGTSGCSWEKIGTMSVYPTPSFIVDIILSGSIGDPVTVIYEKHHDGTVTLEQYQKGEKIFNI